MNSLCTKIVKTSVKLNDNFNPANIIIITVALSQGIQGLSDLSIQYMFKDDFKVSPARMGLLMSYITLPWMVKPLWGILTDSKPFLGYRRKSYLILFGLTGSLGWIILALYGMSNLYYSLAILFCIQFSVCFANVVGEAILVELAGKDNKSSQQQNGQISDLDKTIQDKQNNQGFQNAAAKNVSLFFGVRALGSLASAYFSGALLVYITKKQIFLITSIFPFILACVALFLKEERVLATDLSDRRVNTKQCLIDFWQFFKNPLIYKPIILIFCFMMAPSSGAIMFYFYTTVLHFKPEFLGQLKFLYGFGAIAGILLYNTFLKGVSFKKIFLTTTIMYYFCYQSLIILVTRKNVEWGINDKLFCIGDSVMLQLVGELNLLPILVLACKMCPKNIEGTMYAMLMSTINFGSIIGSQFGAVFLIILKIDEHDFSRLWLFIAITGLFSLLPLPFLYVVKEQEINEQLDKKEAIQITQHSINQDLIQVENGENLFEKSLNLEKNISDPENYDEQQSLLKQHQEVQKN